MACRSGIRLTSGPRFRPLICSKIRRFYKLYNEEKLKLTYLKGAIIMMNEETKNETGAQEEVQEKENCIKRCFRKTKEFVKANAKSGRIVRAVSIGWLPPASM